MPSLVLFRTGGPTPSAAIVLTEPRHVEDRDGLPGVGSRSDDGLPRCERLFGDGWLRGTPVTGFRGTRVWVLGDPLLAEFLGRIRLG